MIVIVGNDNADAELRKLNWRTLSKIELNPYYTDFRHSSDIAVLTLEQSLVLTPKINPICLPSIDKSDETYEGKTAIVAGWGLTKAQTNKTSEKQLKHVKVPIISNTACKSYYSWIMGLVHLSRTISYCFDLYVSVSIFAPITNKLDIVQEIQADPSSSSMKKTG